MSFDDNKAIIQRFVESFNRGNLHIIDEIISRDFFNYVPAEREETAPEVMRRLAADLIAAIPDFKIEVADFVDQGETISFNATLSGTHRNVLWGAPAEGKHISWSAPVTSHFSGGKFNFEWVDFSMPKIVGVMRELNVIPAPEDMDKPSKYPVEIPEFLLKMFFMGRVEEEECSHLDMIKLTDTETNECADCVASGDVWPALRMCLVCGYVGCCDASKNKHMKQHYERTGHPIFRSIRMQESWVWCYEENKFFSGRILDRYR